MQSFQTFLLESFDKPARWRWKEKPEPVDGIESKDIFFSATFKSGVEYTVRINTFKGKRYWSVEFLPSSDARQSSIKRDVNYFLDKGYTNPKNANSQEVLATVIDIVREFVEIVDPNHIQIEALKEGQIDDLNRPRIYKKLIDRFLPNNYTSTVDEVKNGTFFDIKKTG